LPKQIREPQREVCLTAPSRNPLCEEFWRPSVCPRLPFDYSEIVGDSKDRIAADVVDDAEIVQACVTDC
jgi:hypothetical protein